MVIGHLEVIDSDRVSVATPAEPRSRSFVLILGSDKLLEKCR